MLFVDSKTYRLIIAVNGQVPGPNIIVHEEQTVIINVKNNLTTEGVSIHWHGLHQMNTPWMDGVGQVTQWWSVMDFTHHVMTLHCSTSLYAYAYVDWHGSSSLIARLLHGRVWLSETRQAGP